MDAQTIQGNDATWSSDRPVLNYWRRFRLKPIKIVVLFAVRTLSVVRRPLTGLAHNDRFISLTAIKLHACKSTI
jgi:hypothetical protein